jgi:hypothetical protein
VSGIGFAILAGLEPRPITIVVAGERFTVRAALADVWLQAWARHGLAHLMGGMLSSKTDEYRWYRLMSRDPDRAAGMTTASRQLFGKAAGCEWWVAERLAIQSVTWTGVGGELYSQGLRPAEVPLAVWLASAYRVMMLAARKEDRAAIEGSLMLPPDGYDTGELPELEDIFTP